MRTKGVTPQSLTVVYEDNHLIAAIKAFNVPVQGDSSGDPDMLTYVKQYLKEKYAKPGNAFIGLLHRLDRPAGGLMVFAKTSKAASRLGKAFQHREVEKEYLCVVCGQISRQQGQLKHWLRKDRKSNIVEAFENPKRGSKEATLHYEVLARTGELSLISVQMKTGRSHQIRCQLNKIGHPLFGDQKYGKRTGNGQLALWSTRMSFAHPISGNTLTMTSVPPTHAPWSRFDTANSQAHSRIPSHTGIEKCGDEEDHRIGE